ncbi:hypothetical protein [Thiomicrorhabdus sp.]|uniref:hypothetical protein n=1 Tax=Thiomicrorhabdus sp. TaxID=2039724 RepID=UPI0029C643D8|nr:hypothetical protein [Thiomicrorhabdus sp.]
MFGDQDNIDPSFMDRLPVSYRTPALELISQADLRSMLIMRKQGVPIELENKYQLSAEQWRQIINSVILTKLSTFEINTGFPNRYINKLVEIVGAVYGMPNRTARQLEALFRDSHPHFAEWLANLHRVQMLNARQNGS